MRRRSSRSQTRMQRRPFSACHPRARIRLRLFGESRDLRSLLLAQNLSTSQPRQNPNRRRDPQLAEFQRKSCHFHWPRHLSPKRLRIHHNLTSKILLKTRRKSILHSIHRVPNSNNKKMPRILSRNCDLLCSKKRRFSAIKTTGSPRSTSRTASTSTDSSSSRSIRRNDSLCYSLSSSNLLHGLHDLEDDSFVNLGAPEVDEQTAPVDDWGFFVELNSPADYDRKFLTDFTGRIGSKKLKPVQEL